MQSGGGSSGYCCSVVGSKHISSKRCGQGLAKASDESASADITQEASSAEYKSFDTLTEDYAAFCAKPAAQRRFYEYQDGKVVEVKLDDKM